MPKGMHDHPAEFGVTATKNSQVIAVFSSLAVNEYPSIFKKSYKFHKEQSLLKWRCSIILMICLIISMTLVSPQLPTIKSLQLFFFL